MCRIVRSNPAKSEVPAVGERTAFIRIDEVEHRADVQAVSHSGFVLAACQCLGDLVVPTALPHERVPNVNFFVCGSASNREASLQNLIVAQALFYQRDDVSVADAQKGEKGDAGFIV